MIMMYFLTKQDQLGKKQFKHKKWFFTNTAFGVTKLRPFKNDVTLMRWSFYKILWSCHRNFLWHHLWGWLPPNQGIPQSIFGLPIQLQSFAKLWLTFQIQIWFLKRIDNPMQIQSQSNFKNIHLSYFVSAFSF